MELLIYLALIILCDIPTAGRDASPITKASHSPDSVYFHIAYYIVPDGRVGCDNYDTNYSYGISPNEWYQDCAHYVRPNGDMYDDRSLLSYGFSNSLFFQVFLQRDKIIYNSSPERREFSNIMKASSLSNAQKSELTFDINAFDRPLELSKYQAWGTLIAQLALYTPGTFPSDPRIGCELTYQLFNDEDHMNNIFVPKLEKQVADYLPDIPLKGIRFIPYTGNISEYAGVYFMTITFDDAGNLVTVVTAMKESIF